MPFLQVNVEQEIQKQRENDPEFKKIWDESRAEYRLIGEMISLRKKKKITQKELALLTGNKQQVISRIERKESIPTIRAFTQPFRGISATVRADIYGFCFRHSILNLA